MASQAAWSPSSFWPRPSHLMAFRAAFSVARTNSNSRIRSRSWGLRRGGKVERCGALWIMSGLSGLPGGCRRGSRLERLLRLEDAAGDLDQLGVPVARHLLHPAVRFGLVEPGPLHDDALGPLDQLAVRQGLP